MRMKDSDITTKNLNPVFTEPLKKFDQLHTQITGNQAVVTSVDTGRHWGSIKKENRPVGWEDFTEAQVREFSDSKHYTDEALDFRRRCPHGKLTYYDDLTESEQRVFMVEIYKYFPDDLFDITFSRLCIHCEFDPKPRKLTPKDLDPRDTEKFKRDTRLQEFKDALIATGTIKPTKLKKPKFDISTFDIINWKIIPKALINGVFRHFTKFSLFSTADKPGLIAKLTELLQAIINKLTKRGK